MSHALDSNPAEIAQPSSLLLANTAIESDAGPVDICADAALEAAHLILDGRAQSRRSGVASTHTRSMSILSVLVV